MVTEVEMTVWIRLVQGSEKVKDQDVDETHRKNERVYSKGRRCMLKKMVCKLRDEEVRGLDMVRTVTNWKVI